MLEHYLACLPPRWRTTTRPTSSWWRWRDHDVHVLTAGDVDAPARVVVLHGAGGHSAALWPYAGLLADRYDVRVVVPDLPGYGATRVPRRSGVRYGDWVALVSELLRAQRSDHEGPLVVVGASMGGMLAYDAATRTGLADHVVATCLLDPRDPVARAHIGRWAWQGRLARPALRLAAGPLAAATVPLRWLVDMRAIANDPALVELVLRDRCGGGTSLPLGFLRSYLESAPAVEPDEATNGTLVLAHPTDDRWTPVEVSLRFFRRLAVKAEHVPLESAGHFPVEERAVGQLVDVFARWLRPRP